MYQLWTKHGARLECVRSSAGLFNWLFLPGGPGLGSECLHSLTSILKVPGTIWHLDLPGDGSNSAGEICNWAEALVEATGALDNVILVGHSRGGMFALALPELQQNLVGLVLLDSAPNMQWKSDFAPEEGVYTDNASLREFVLAGAPYMFTKEGLAKGRKMLEGLPYNLRAIQWTQDHFDPTYEAKWIPHMPALILSGAEDQATPLKYFAENRAFHRNNIVMKEIPHAGHFPWIENPQGIIDAFSAFL